MSTVVLGNIIAFIGALFMVGVGFLKQRKSILAAQSMQFLIMGIGNLILGGLPGFVSNVLGIARNVFCLKHELPLWLGCVFVAVQAALTVPVNSLGLIGWLPVAAALIFTLSINTKNEIVLKLVIIAGQLCWIFYDFTIKNYVSVFFDVFTVVSNLCGIAMLKCGKKAAKSAASKN